MSDAERLARWRVPVGWGLGLLLLALARPTPSSLLLGGAFSAMGEMIRLWASGHLEKNRRLTTSGPYAWTRNPLYLGSFVVGAGFCVASGQPVFVALLVVLFGAVYAPVMKREAARLEAAYPDAYRSYAERVPLFVPALRPERSSDEEARFAWSRVVGNREHVTLAGIALVVAILLGKLLLFQAA